MFDFFVGMLAGMILMDLIWAWKIGVVETVIQWVSLKWKLFRAKENI
mgnify:FL=1